MSKNKDYLQELTKIWEQRLIEEGLGHSDVNVNSKRVMVCFHRTAAEASKSRKKTHKQKETEQYFYVIQTYLHYAKLNKAMEKYKEMLLDYTLTGNLTEKCIKYGFNRSSVSVYIGRNFKKMLKFTFEFDKEQ